MVKPISYDCLYSINNINWMTKSLVQYKTNFVFKKLNKSYILIYNNKRFENIIKRNQLKKNSISIILFCNVCSFNKFLYLHPSIVHFGFS